MCFFQVKNAAASGSVLFLLAFARRVLTIGQGFLGAFPWRWQIDA